MTPILIFTFLITHYFFQYYEEKNLALVIKAKFTNLNKTHLTTHFLNNDANSKAIPSVLETKSRGTVRKNQIIIIVIIFLKGIVLLVVVIVIMLLFVLNVIIIN